MPDPRQNLGKEGESLAAAYLRQKGWKIEATNYRCRAGEVDIVARSNSHLVFVEVKTRKNTDIISPLRSVHRHKQQRIARAAIYYMKKQGLNSLRTPCRFDVITVNKTTGEVGHWPGAFRFSRGSR